MSGGVATRYEEVELVEALSEEEEAAAGEAVEAAEVEAQQTAEAR